MLSNPEIDYEKVCLAFVDVCEPLAAERPTDTASALELVAALRSWFKRTNEASARDGELVVEQYERFEALMKLVVKASKAPDDDDEEGGPF